MRDAAEIREIYAPYVETPVSFENAVPSEEEVRRRIGKAHVWLVSECGGRVAGYAYASKHREREAYHWSVESSVYVHRAFHRRGIGRRLYERLFSELRSRGFVNVYAGITLPNAASVALHQSFGFEPVGIFRHIGFKLGRWHDVGWWSHLLGKLPADPRRPDGSAH